MNNFKYQTSNTKLQIPNSGHVCAAVGETKCETGAAATFFLDVVPPTALVIPKERSD
jgi:hypothetical protein